MRKVSWVVLMMAAFAMTASAQTKISGKEHCAKADPSYTVEAGDRAGHVLMLQKAACTWTTPLEIAGAKTKEGTDTSTTEVTGETGKQNGYHTSTMDNGDKFFVHYWGTMKMNKDGSAALEGQWTFTGGTGKMKGIKGKGTYKGMGAADGSGDADIEGEYTLPEAKAAAPAKPPKAPAKK